MADSCLALALASGGILCGPFSCQVVPAQHKASHVPPSPARFTGVPSDVRLWQRPEVRSRCHPPVLFPARCAALVEAASYSKLKRVADFVRPNDVLPEKSSFESDPYGKPGLPRTDARRVAFWFGKRTFPVPNCQDRSSSNKISIAPNPNHPPVSRSVLAAAYVISPKTRGT